MSESKLSILHYVTLIKWPTLLKYDQERIKMYHHIKMKFLHPLLQKL